LLMTARPPTSTPFPYTTLFRSVRRRGAAGRACPAVARGHPQPAGAGGGLLPGRDGDAVLLRPALPAPDARRARHLYPRDDRGRRSEEHTSELQSLTNLVCRLLL